MVQYRQLPPAGDRDAIETVWQAVPHNPEATDDCCRRLCDRTAIENREQASEWLVFLSALGCITDDGDGYHRGEDSLDLDRVEERFESAVYGVDSVLAVLETAERPLTKDEILERLPVSTRESLRRTGDAENHIRRVLEWGVVFDRLDRYRETYSLSL